MNNNVLLHKYDTIENTLYFQRHKWKAILVEVASFIHRQKLFLIQAMVVDNPSIMKHLLKQQRVLVG